jgi:hypothetical protein
VQVVNRDDRQLPWEFEISPEQKTVGSIEGQPSFGIGLNHRLRQGSKELVHVQGARTRQVLGGRNDSGMRIADGAYLTFSLTRRRKTRAVNPEVLQAIPPWPFMSFPFNYLPREGLLSGTARKMRLLGSGSDADHVYGTDD